MKLKCKDLYHSFLNIRNAKGISLIALIVTIIVIIILSSIVYFGTNNALNSMAEGKFKAELRGLMDRLKIYHEKANLESISYKSNLLSWNGISPRATNTGKVENGVDEDTPEFIFGTIPARFQDRLIISKGKLSVITDELSDDEISWVVALGIQEVSEDGTEIVKNTITFDPNGGSVSQGNVTIRQGRKIGTLPTPTRTDNTFLGWFTEATGGEQIHSDRIVDGDATYYAHWTDKPVELDGNYYASVTAALNTIKDSNARTIHLLKNVSEAITIPSGRVITIDFQGNTINNSGNTNVFINSGNLTLLNGNIKSDAATNGAINNNKNATLTINSMDVQVYGGGGRQALYNKGGTATIMGGSSLSSVASARTAVHNLNDGATKRNDVY